MQKLKGTGRTFSTSGKTWKPFRANLILVRKKAKAWRVKKAGHALPDDKASLRKIAEQAAGLAKPKA